ncbi:enoyl-CoA hydratase [Parvularcula sp. ZS-1/3]|uniref:enoyl-CoA hydratase n=1 Tax=Parvularcula mediterranea TaxID=2732508 RepID=A0A7Y3RKE6_9PROT|nr:enoyl-CoA hydratase [Parvularcula mediterranea]NNU15300.1 enoyl-CoA hydratase [Parvularcula mediterranea]
MAYNCLEIDNDDRVQIIRLARPEALNAFNKELMDELTEALKAADADPKVACIVLTGSEKAFAAGADIKEMADKSFVQAYTEDFITANWEEASRIRTPIIAAVAGYALGGGCEMAMMCDFVIAADNAKFGQPEITIGAIPGAGGTQRMAKYIGKAKAMDMCLTGRMMGAEEAERCGLVARVVPKAELMDTALEAAKKIAGFSRPISMMVKECVNRAFEVPLSEGIRFERRVFHSVFATEDQKEGMKAFVEKRDPNFKDA